MQLRPVLSLATTLLIASPVAAQTRFEWPDTAVDISAYQTVEECRAAVRRVREAVRVRAFHETLVWQDTALLHREHDEEPVAADVGETARRCLTGFRDARTAPVEEFRFLVPLYLLAGWDDQARILADRRFEGVADSTQEYAAVVDTLLDIYRGSAAQDPGLGINTRVDLIDDLTVRRVAAIPDRVRRLFALWKTTSGSITEGRVDTARIERIASRIVALVDSLDEDERRRVWEEASLLGMGEEQSERIGNVVQYSTQTFMDSLASSTEEYVRARRNLWARTTGQPPETYQGGSPIGEKAPEIIADYWLGCEENCGPRPVPGRVNLIVFLGRNHCTGVANSEVDLVDRCARVLVPLRRLMARFPALEVTIISNTDGYFGYLKEDITPEEEARLTREWLDSFGIDAPLAVVNTESWRISEHDRRRVPVPDANVENYSFGRTTAPEMYGTYLVDGDGIVVHERQANRHSEVEYARMIEVLLERDAGR